MTQKCLHKTEKHRLKSKDRKTKTQTHRPKYKDCNAMAETCVHQTEKAETCVHQAETCVHQTEKAKTEKRRLGNADSKK